MIRKILKRWIDQPQLLVVQRLSSSWNHCTPAVLVGRRESLHWTTPVASCEQQVVASCYPLFFSQRQFTSSRGVQSSNQDKPTNDCFARIPHISQAISLILPNDSPDDVWSQEAKALQVAWQRHEQILADATTGTGEEDDVRRRRRRLESLQNLRECLETLSHWDVALQVEEEYCDDLSSLSSADLQVDRAASLHRQGKLFMHLGQPVKSQLRYEGALDLYRKEYGESQWRAEIGQVLISMAGVPYHRTQFEASMDLLKQAEPHFAHHGKSNTLTSSENMMPDIGLVRCLEHQGLLYRVTQNFSKALETYERALDMLDAVAQKVPEDVRSTWIEGKRLGLEMDSADMYVATDRYKEAEKIYESILKRSIKRQHEEGREAIESTVTAAQSGTAVEGVIMHSLGKVHARQHDYHRARDELTRAVEIKQRLMGELHPEVASSLSALGAVYAVLDDRHKALECFQQSLLIARMSAKEGDNNPEVMYALRNISVLKGEQIPKWGEGQDE